MATVHAAADGPVAGAVERAAARVREQQAQLARLRREARAPVHSLPLLPGDAPGPEACERLAARLARALA